MKTKIMYSTVFIVLLVLTPQFLSGQISKTKKYKYTVEPRFRNRKKSLFLCAKS